MAIGRVLGSQEKPGSRRNQCCPLRSRAPTTHRPVYQRLPCQPHATWPTVGYFPVNFEYLWRGEAECLRSPPLLLSRGGPAGDGSQIPGWRWVSNRRLAMGLKSPDPSDAFCDAMCARAGRLAASLASTREYHQSSRILRWSSSTPVRSLCASSSLRDIIANPLLASLPAKMPYGPPGP